MHTWPASSSFSASSCLLLLYPRNLDSYLVRAWRGETVAKILRVPGHSVREKAVVERAQLFVPPREPPVLCDKPPSHARSILGGHRIQPRGRRAPLLLLLLAFPPTDFQSPLRSYNLRISIGGRFSTVSFRRVWKFRYSLPSSHGDETWNYRKIKAGRGRCK